MQSIIDIKEGAIFISDAHDNINRRSFLQFLKKIDTKELNPPQLFLMGDLFDFLAYGASYTIKFYKKQIELINKISQKIPTYYLEGNHDFNLQKIFPYLKVFPIEKQPILVSYKDKKGLISHGDIYSGWIYKLSHKILRNYFFLKLLDIINGERFSKNYLQKASKKIICKKIPNFENIIKQKISLYDIAVSDIDFILEGHYHQGVTIKINSLIYINLHSYFCDKRYFTLQDKIDS